MIGFLLGSVGGAIIMGIVAGGNRYGYQPNDCGNIGQPPVGTKGKDA